MQKNYPKKAAKKPTQNKKCIFICGIHSIIVKEDLREGILISPSDENQEMPKIKLTNNKYKIRSLLDTLNPDMTKLIGVIEVNHLLNNYPIVAYFESDFDGEKTTSIQYLNLHLLLLKAYFICLWVEKDNAADFDIGFLAFTNQSGDLEVSSNVMTNANFNSNGKTEATVFTKDQLVSALQFLSNFVLVEYQDATQIFNASSVHRRAIAIYFIQSARCTNDLGIKAANYCSMLESLFANGDTSELSHRLSERVSKFLRENLRERIELYKTLKKLYNLRSKVVHGANYKVPGENELTTLVETADLISREIMAYCLSTREDNIFEKSVEDLNNYFLTLSLQ